MIYDVCISILIGVAVLLQCTHTTLPSLKCQFVWCSLPFIKWPTSIGNKWQETLWYCFLCQIGCVWSFENDIYVTFVHRLGKQKNQWGKSVFNFCLKKSVHWTFSVMSLSRWTQKKRTVRVWSEKSAWLVSWLAIESLNDTYEISFILMQTHRIYHMRAVCNSQLRYCMLRRYPVHFCVVQMEHTNINLFLHLCANYYICLYYYREKISPRLNNKRRYLIYQYKHTHK